MAADSNSTYTTSFDFHCILQAKNAHLLFACSCELARVYMRLSPTSRSRVHATIVSRVHATPRPILIIVYINWVCLKTVCKRVSPHFMNGSCSIGKRWYTSGVRSLYKYPVFRLPDKPELAGQVSKSWHPRGTYVAPLPLGLWDSDQGCSTAFLVSEPSSKKIVEKQPYFFSETFSIHGNHLRIASKEYASWVESREKKMVENKLVLLGKSWFWCIQKVVGHAPQFLPFSWGTACLLISRPCLPARRPMCLRYAPKAIRALQKTNHKRVTINIITLQRYTQSMNFKTANWWCMKDMYPPTPADARGSALGNNTFDSCFGLQN